MPTCSLPALVRLRMNQAYMCKDVMQPRRQALTSFLRCCPPFPAPTGVELTDLTRLAGQQAPRICLVAAYTMGFQVYTIMPDFFFFLNVASGYQRQVLFK